MIKTFRVDIEGFGKACLLNGRKGKVQSVHLWTDSTQPLQVSVIADGYRELVSDYLLQGSQSVKLPVQAQVKTRNLRAVVKSAQEFKAGVIISVEYA